MKDWELKHKKLCKKDAEGRKVKGNREERTTSEKENLENISGKLTHMMEGLNNIEGRKGADRDHLKGIVVNAVEACKMEKREETKKPVKAKAKVGRSSRKSQIRGSEEKPHDGAGAAKLVVEVEVADVVNVGVNAVKGSKKKRNNKAMKHLKHAEAIVGDGEGCEEGSREKTRDGAVEDVTEVADEVKLGARKKKNKTKSKAEVGLKCGGSQSGRNGEEKQDGAIGGRSKHGDETLRSEKKPEAGK